MTINPSNLSWRQWYKAAGFNSSEMILISSLKWQAMRQAWKAGESPNLFKRESEAAQ